MAVATPIYTVHDGEPVRDRDTVLALWRGNLGQEAKMASKYDWFYLGSPSGPPLLQLLRHEPSNSCVGVCSAGRRRMQWRGAPLRAGVLVDLAVVPEHRSLGPALMLQQGLIAAGKRELDLLYGFPNPKAAAVFKRIGYRKLADIVRHARVLRHANYLARRLPAPLAAVLGPVLDACIRTRDAWRARAGPRLTARWSDSVDPRMDALWQNSSQGEHLMAVRDCAHLRWRFDAAPLGRTRYLLLSTPDSDDLSGWFALQDDNGTLHVRDFWTLDAAGGVGNQYIDALLGAARQAGAVAVSVEIAGAESRLAGWQARGFVERSRRPVFGAWSAADQPDFDLHLTSADEDE